MLYQLSYRPTVTRLERQAVPLVKTALPTHSHHRDRRPRAAPPRNTERYAALTTIVAVSISKHPSSVMAKCARTASGAPA